MYGRICTLSLDMIQTFDCFTRYEMRTFSVFLHTILKELFDHLFWFTILTSFQNVLTFLAMNFGKQYGVISVIFRCEVFSQLFVKFWWVSFVPERMRLSLDLDFYKLLLCPKSTKPRKQIYLLTILQVNIEFRVFLPSFFGLFG